MVGTSRDESTISINGTNWRTRTCIQLRSNSLGSALATPFELNCGDYDFKSASVRHGAGGAVFRCTMSPVTDETLQGLADAVRSKRVIRFAFPKHPLILEGIEVVLVAPGRVRIAGRVLDD